MTITLNDLQARTASAVAHYWLTRNRQDARQTGADADRGARGSVTGGKQMDGFPKLVQMALVENGLGGLTIRRDGPLELPGYFRPTKKWDLLVLRNGQVLAALEFKSQVGPSFGNNFNNRCEEAIGSGHDLRIAFRERALGQSGPPFLGWVMLLEDSPRSQVPVDVAEPHFRVFPEFRGASYAKRYELLLRRLTSERLYDAAALVLAKRVTSPTASHSEPAPDLTLRSFLCQLIGHLAGRVEGTP